MAAFQYDPALTSEPTPIALDFRDTTYFRSHAALPEIETVRNKTRWGEKILEELGLFVKFGRPYNVRIEDAQTLQALRHAFPNGEVPVPELYGWRSHEGTNYIFMSLIQGCTMEDAWPTMTVDDKSTVVSQLRNALSAVRTVKLEEPFIGSIERGRVQDPYFYSIVNGGPYSSVKEFNDQLQIWSLPWLSLSQRPPDPLRALLPDAAHIVFSHGDLSLPNIMVSGSPGSYKLAAIIDWAYGGWYPDYWEFCKLLLNTGDLPLGEEGWPGQILNAHDLAYDAVMHYWSCRVP